MNTDILLALIQLFLPLISFLVLIFFGKKIGKNASNVGLFFIGLMLLITIRFLYISIFHSSLEPIIDASGNWFSTGAFIVNLGIYFDSATAIMSFVVALISFLVHLYSVEYMKGDPRYSDILHSWEFLLFQ